MTRHNFCARCSVVGQRPCGTSPAPTWLPGYRFERWKNHDSEGKEVFSHTYHYVGIEEVRGLYEFKSDDADSGEFTYFCIAPDTNDTTYHIELRYGSDLEALGKYDEGDYAYWLGSGISTDYDQTMVENCIELFCKENLSE